MPTRDEYRDAPMPGKQVTVAHPSRTPRRKSAPIPTLTPSAAHPDAGETAIIAGDMAVRSARERGLPRPLFRHADPVRFRGRGGAALTQVNDMLNRLLQFTICPVTRH
ncbi:MAG: ethanolamine utilization protein EutS [Bilophila wadsworthia]